ncbi:MAG: beta-ketoacyl-ACP synthase II [Micavibrio sp.]|nr:beta-ketoacyl-ACP synthase II [Micavibrio sp.]
MRRVVITGMGIVSPLGLGLEHNWQAITAGKSGIRTIAGFDASDLPSRVAGEVLRVTETDKSAHLLDLNKYIEHKEQKKMDEFIHLGYVAAVDAVEDSGWKPEDYEGQCRTGVLIGSGIGGLKNIQDTSIMMDEKGPRRISPFFIPSSLINLISGQVSIRYGFKGPNHAVVTACATGSHAIGDAARLIAFDDADVMVAGGAEAAICRVGVGGFAACRALSTGFNDTPERASRPFDKGRDGFVIGEGAGVVVLEEYEHAKKRGAKIYAEVIGYGLSGDAYHVTSPSEDGDGGFRAMKAAMKRAQLNPEDVDYINAHGTSTPLGDDIELGAIKRMFGDALKTASISSTKSAIGHLLGAAGAVEAIYSAKAIETGIVPPTLNLEDPSDVAAGLDLVPKAAKQRKVNVAVSNSFGFGGTNACLVLRKV